MSSKSNKPKRRASVSSSSSSDDDFPIFPQKRIKTDTDELKARDVSTTLNSLKDQKVINEILKNVDNSVLLDLQVAISMQIQRNAQLAVVLPKQEETKSNVKTTPLSAIDRKKLTTKQHNVEHDALQSLFLSSRLIITTNKKQGIPLHVLAALMLYELKNKHKLTFEDCLTILSTQSDDVFNAWNVDFKVNENAPFKPSGDVKSYSYQATPKRMIRGEISEETFSLLLSMPTITLKTLKLKPY